MTRRVSVFVAVVAVLATMTPGRAEHYTDPSPPDPRHRLGSLIPKPAGTIDTIVLQYGPYVVHPGSDLTRADAELVLHDMQVIAARPAVRLLDGTEPPDEQVHIHHAHWIKPNVESSSGYDWFFGTGEERTRGGGWDYMAADAATWDAGIRHAITMSRGEQMGFISMLHNKTATPLTLWIEGRFEIVWGSREEIRAATAADPSHPLWGDEAAGIPAGSYTSDGIDVRPLTPVLHGDTFQVPRSTANYVYPRDVGPGDPNHAAMRGSLQPNVGHVWTAPTDGIIVIGAGHLHPGGKQVIVSNLGSQASPCANTDGDDFAGKTILKIDAYYRTYDDTEFLSGADLAGTMFFPSEEFQMGITQRGWRAWVRAGDRIAINGTYDASEYAYPDAMSFFGFYLDPEATVDASDACRVELADEPGAPLRQIVSSRPNRPWEINHPATFCDPCDDPARAEETLGQWTNVVTIAGFAYLPGQQGTMGITGVPWANRGETITFVNADYAEALVRHSVTSCRWPCNGLYSGNYPFHDGDFDSGSIGFTPVETYEMGTDEPLWRLDTSDLTPGLYSYYCRLHPAMRGAFAVV